MFLYDSATAIDTVELEDEDKVFFPDSDEDEWSIGNNYQVYRITGRADGCGATPIDCVATINRRQLITDPVYRVSIKISLKYSYRCIVIITLIVVCFRVSKL